MLLVVRHWLGEGNAHDAADVPKSGICCPSGGRTLIVSVNYTSIFSASSYRPCFDM